MNKFQRYIDQLGDREAARQLGHTERTVAAWRRGENRPRLRTAEKLVQAADAAFSFGDIYAPEQSSRTPTRTAVNTCSQPFTAAGGGRP